MFVHSFFVNVQAELLNTVLGSLRIQTVQLARVELFAPWGGPVATEADLLLHHVVEGSAWLSSASGETRELTAGDVTLSPSHFSHTLSDALTTPAHDSSFWEAGETLPSGASAVRRRVGGDGARTVLLCAALEITGAGKHAIQDAIPRPIFVQGSDRSALSNFAAVLELIRDEVRQSRAGAPLMLARYAEILVLGLLRSAPPAPTPNWLAASSHPGLAKALSAIHSRPRETWSVANLAKEAGMSRSAFADAFTRLVGEGPIRYLTRWRLVLAKELFETGTAGSVEAIAEQVGYANAAAFSTAFRREFGVSPGGLRRRPPFRPSARS